MWRWRQSEGGELATGGHELERAEKGYYMARLSSSTRLVRCAPNQEEMFGPITCVLSVADLDEAIDVANDTPYGLTAGIATRSLARATKFRRASRSGCVMVNLPTAGTDYHVPFGGTRASSYGPREQGRAAVEFYNADQDLICLRGSRHMTRDVAEAPTLIDGLQYCNWSRDIFQQMRQGGMSAVHATVSYHDGFRDTVRQSRGMELALSRPRPLDTFGAQRRRHRRRQGVRTNRDFSRSAKPIAYRRRSWPRRDSA